MYSNFCISSQYTISWQPAKQSCIISSLIQHPWTYNFRTRTNDNGLCTNNPVPKTTYIRPRVNDTWTATPANGFGLETNEFGYTANGLGQQSKLYMKMYTFMVSDLWATTAYFRVGTNDLGPTRAVLKGRYTSTLCHSIYYNYLHTCKHHWHSFMYWYPWRGTCPDETPVH
jgi:hypothetical protein